MKSRCRRRLVVCRNAERKNRRKKVEDKKNILRLAGGPISRTAAGDRVHDWMLRSGIQGQVLCSLRVNSRRVQEPKHRYGSALDA